MGLLAGLHADELLPGAGSGVEIGEGFVFDMKRDQLDVWQPGGRQGKPDAVLDLASTADDAARRASNQHSRAECLAHQRRHVSILGSVVGRNERHSQVRRLRAQVVLDLADSLVDSVTK